MFLSNVAVLLLGKIYKTLFNVGQPVLLLVLNRTLFLLKYHFFRTSTRVCGTGAYQNMHIYLKVLILILGKICGIRVGDTLDIKEI